MDSLIIEKYAKYNISIKITEGYYLIGIHFPQKWKVIEPQDTSIKYLNDDEDKTMFYYMTQVVNGTKGIFESVDETIAFNRELEKKTDLIREKIVELRDLFVNETYENLLTLRFVVGEEKKVKGRGRKKVVKETETPAGKEVIEKKAETPSEGAPGPVIEAKADNLEEVKCDEVKKEPSPVPGPEVTGQKGDTDTQPAEKNTAEAGMIDDKIASAIRNKGRSPRKR